MYLVFDTETSGFIQKNCDINAPEQARIMQLAFVQLDELFNEVACFKSPIVIPDSTIVHEGAFVAHGLTKEFCCHYGMNIALALDILADKLYTANKVICHNAPFDIGVVELECKRVNNDTIHFDDSDTICTMRALTPLCRLPHKNGKKNLFGQEFKWPTLSEATRFCFNEELVGAHDALTDVRATARLFKWLVDNSHVNVGSATRIGDCKIASSPMPSNPLPVPT